MPKELSESELSEKKARKKAYMKQYCINNKERIAEQQKNYKELHKEKIDAYDKMYREMHREKAKAYNKQYYKDNQQRIKKRAKNYRKNNRERIAAYDSRYREKNKDKKRKYNREHYRKNRKTTLGRAHLRLTDIQDDSHLEEIESIVEVADQLEISTGIPHQIDHFLPRRLGGLSVPRNLFPIPSKVNRDKWHHYWTKQQFKRALRRFYLKNRISISSVNAVLAKIGKAI